MTPAPFPADELERQAALNALQILDSPAEDIFDALVAAASQLCETPISLISLIDHDRQWFKARLGLPNATQTPRDWAFCAHTIQGDELFQVCDAAVDPRFADNPLVRGQPHIRFYAGAPIRLSAGQRVGTLCVIDQQPRRLDAQKTKVLTQLAGAAARAMEMRLAEKELGEQSQRLQAILDSTGAGSWEVDLDSGDVRINAQYAHMLGYEPQALRQRIQADFMGLVHPDDHEATLGAWFEHIEGRAAEYASEFRCQHADGSWVWLMSRGAVSQRNAKGRPIKVAGIQLNVSVQHQAVERAERAARDLQNAMDAMPALAAYIDAGLRFRFCNRAYAEWFELDMQRVPGTPVAEILGSAFYEQNRAYMERALQGEEQNFERDIPNPDGSGLRHSLARYIPDRRDGVVLGFYVFVLDLSEVKRAHGLLEQLNAQLLERTREAEAASVSKSAFLANMSHELRTPMNGILGLHQLLMQTPMTPQQLDYLSRSEDAAKSLLHLLNDLLDLSKIEAGKMTLELLPFSLERLMAELASTVAGLLGAKNIDLLYDLDPRIPDGLRGDVTRLKQVLINLAGNAIKFTGAGEVVIGVRLLERGENQVRLRCWVRDTGIGIAPEHQQRVFDVFSQAEASTTRRFGGTGLGLSISRRMVEMMGGRLQLDSAPGHGSNFFFDLALELMPGLPLRTPAQDEPAGAAGRLLIVGGSAHAAELLRSTAATLGWQAEQTDAEHGALQRLQQTQDDPAQAFALVVVDSHLGEVDSWELVRQLRQVTATTRPLLLMVLSNAAEVMAQRSEREQALLDGYLTRPFTAGMLREAISAARVHAQGGASRRVARPSQRRLEGLRLLLAEDHPLNQMVAERMLVREGALVYMAANGRMAVDAVASAKPQFDAVLMDIQMPIMDGYEATRVIRQELGLTTLPIIALSANAMPEERAQSIAVGMNEHIGKPFNLTRLVELILRVSQPAGALPAAETEPPA